MAARQRRMSVDHINRLRGVQLPYSPQKTRVEQLPRAREPKISGNLRVSHPFRCSRWTRMFSRIVNRRCCNHAGVDTELPERFDRFRDKATADLILVRRKKRGER